MIVMTVIRRIGWALFGNDDDGIYGDLNWNPKQEKTWKRAVQWWFRNPMHNLFFYVLGVCGKPFTRTGLYPKDNFSPVGGWNRCVIHYKRLRLPFVSYIGAVKFYVGWRERGNFGVKLTRGDKKTVEQART